MHLISGQVDILETCLKALLIQLATEALHVFEKKMWSMFTGVSTDTSMR